MTLKELYVEVARRADTAGTKIGAAEVNRVLSETFLVLDGLETHVVTGLLTKGLETARRKGSPKKKP